MNLAIIPTIAISAVIVAGVLLAFNRSKKGEPFTSDKAEWQYESALMLYCEATGKLPEELEESDTDIIWNNACNHCSMFLTWAIMRGYCGESHLSDEPEAVEKVKEREMTGTEFFIKYCDCKLWREDFAEIILPFVDAYYESHYLETYTATTRNKLKKEPLTFSFSWEDYEVFERALDRAYRRWRFWSRFSAK